MKRFHVHVNVHNLDNSIQFYSQLFGSAPSVLKPDYAKWMLDDPRLNFAISQRERAPGVDHLGLQAEDAVELEEIGARLKTAGAVSLAETGATCCYANSDKYWAEDPQGIRWESFHTCGAATSYYAPQTDARCCGPEASTLTSRCGPQQTATPAAAGTCCGG